MTRVLLLLISFSYLLFASPDYRVQLGVFKNGENLKKHINTYPPALKQTVKIHKRGKLFYAYTLSTSNKATLKKLLPAYKKVFKDAYIQPIKGE